MFLKIAVIAIVAFVATTDGSEVWDGYSAKWAANPSDGFFNLPTTSTEARKEGWTRVSDTKLPPGVTLLCYFGDPRFGLIFSTRTKEVVGHQVAVPVADFEKPCLPIDYNNKPGFTKKRLNGDYYFVATAMFKDDKVKGIRQIWIEVDGKFQEIPTNTELVISETPYYSKQCFKWMGNHFYQVNSTTRVSDFFPWFLLSVGKDVIGMGIQAIGNSSSNAKRTWFEDLDTSQSAGVIPDISTEVDEAIREHGLVSVHIYFRKNPVEILCRDVCTAVYNGTGESGSCRAIRKKRALGAGNVC